MIDITRNQKSLAGEFAVLSQLSLRGMDANLTLGYAKSVDILCSNPVTGSMSRIEVKTTSTPASQSGEWGAAIHWQMSEKHDNINDPRLYFVFVHLEEDGKNARYFVVPSVVVGKYCYENHINWMNRADYQAYSDQTNGGKRKFRIALEENGHYSVDTPKSSHYEDAWQLLG